MGLHGSGSHFFMGDENTYGISNRELARSDIRMAMEGEKPHLIDEWQEVPRIWDAVRSDIDRRGEKGAYILTGSAMPKVEPDDRPIHSGAGRIVRVHMHTMSLYESGDSTGSVSLGSIMASEPMELVDEGTDLDPEDRAFAVRGYLESVIKDACHLDDVRRKEPSFWLVVRSLARNESTLASMSKVHKDTGIPLERDVPLILDGMESDTEPGLSYDTVTDYVDALNRLYLLEDQPAFDPNLRSSVRVGKTPKRHFTDPSLAVAALKVGKERLLNDPNTFGFLFEAMCERDLRIYAQSIGANLFHYRDSSGMEVDAIVELENGA